MKVIKALSAFIGYLSDDQAIELTKAVCAYVAGVDTYEFSSDVIAAAYDEIIEVIDKAREVSKRRSEVRKGRKIQEETQDLSQQKSEVLSQQKLNKSNEMSVQTDKSDDLSQQNSNKNEDLFNFCHDKNGTNVSSSSFSLPPTPPNTLLTSLSSIPPIVPPKNSGDSPRKEKSGKKKGQENSLDPSTFGFATDPALLPVFLEWLEYKTERKEIYQPKGLKACYSKLANYSKGDPEVAKKIILEAMGNNSQGFFEPRWTPQQKPQQMARQQAMNPNERYNENDYHGF